MRHRHWPGQETKSGILLLVSSALIIQCLYLQSFLACSEHIGSDTELIRLHSNHNRNRHSHPKGRIALGQHETERRRQRQDDTADNLSSQTNESSEATAAEPSSLLLGTANDKHMLANRRDGGFSTLSLSGRAPPRHDLSGTVAAHAVWPQRDLSKSNKALPRERFQISLLPKLSSWIPYRRAATSPAPMTVSGGHGSNEKVSVQLHSTWTVSSGQLISVVLVAGRILGSAAARILLPLTVTHRLIVAATTAGQDWYTGYYIRTTLQRMEQQYTRRYQVPACLRSLGRLVIHWSTLVALGLVMEWMVGLSHPPCQVHGGCSWWCGMLWIVAVIGPGHLFGVAVAIWVRGLRIQVDDDKSLHLQHHKHRHLDAAAAASADEYQYQQRPSGRRIVTRPFALLRWMIDPGQWFREIIARDRSPDSVLQPFDPDWLMFPATWRSVRVLQMIAVAKEMHGSSNAILRALMRHVILQQAFGDEWYRVLMIEKRVAWSIFLMVGYMGSTLGLVWTMLQKPAHSISSLSILFTVPSLLAVAISGWMNVLVYFDRRQHIRPVNNKGNADPVQEAIDQYKRVTVPLPRDRA